MNAEVIIAIIAAFISGVSIIVSVICAFITYKQNVNLNAINMKAGYYNKIFDEYLIEKIPQARGYIRFENGKLVDGQNLIDVLSEMRKKALYFKYDNKAFFDLLKKNTQDIEDYVMNCGNSSFEPEDQAMVYSEIQKKMEALYGCINESFVGKKDK